MNLRIDDISKIIKDQIKNYASQTQQDEIGYVIQVGDGIAKVHGLDKCKSNELLRFENGSFGMALNLEESCVSVVMLGTDVGIREGGLVKRTGRVVSVPVGEALIGRVVDALGQPIDGKGPFQDGTLFCVENNHYINPMTRPPIRERMEFGVKAIDSMLTIGKGQRIGIFAGSGVGKSTLMGMIAKNVKADINVIALVGERGREVLEFMEKDLGPEGMRRSILVVATSDQPAMLRSRMTISPYPARR